jgi:hypothetical protein
MAWRGQDQEHWKKVKYWPYEVSSFGRVRRTGAACGATPGKVLREGTKKSGHKYVTLYDRGRQETWCVHRLVCEAFHGHPPTPKHEVAHDDGDPGNNHWINLRWATHKENHADQQKHGTANKGVRNGRSKLSEADVIKLRQMAAAKVGTDVIAATFGLHRNSVSQIVRRDRWAHID